ncbi:hypothetical protein IJJ08_03885 [bacterium]|nr:hypothetical protein [bacterium]
MSDKLEQLPDYKDEQAALGQEGIKIPPLKELENRVNADPKHHQWRQKGPYLVCSACKSRHAVYLGLDKVLKTTKNNGEIVLEAITPQE